MTTLNGIANTLLPLVRSARIRDHQFFFELGNLAETTEASVLLVVQARAFPIAIALPRFSDALFSMASSSSCTSSHVPISPPFLSSISAGYIKARLAVAAPFLSSLQYLLDRVAHHETIFVKFDEKNIL